MTIFVLFGYIAVESASLADVQRSGDPKGIEEAKERLTNGEPLRVERPRAPGRCARCAKSSVLLHLSLCFIVSAACLLHITYRPSSIDIGEPLLNLSLSNKKVNLHSSVTLQRKKHGILHFETVRRHPGYFCQLFVSTARYWFPYLSETRIL